MLSVKSKWKEFYLIVNIRLCLIAVNLAMDTDAPVYVENYCVMMDMCAASTVGSRVDRATFVLSAHFHVVTLRKQLATKIPFQLNASFLKKSFYRAANTKL